MSESQSDTVEVHGLRFDVAGMSEQGPRSENQDAYTIDKFATTGIVAVADGMGGERSGRLAADTALQSVLAVGTLRSQDDLKRAVRAADAQVVRTAAENPESHGGMGCALGVLALVKSDGDGTGWIGAHVGDVRIISRAPDGTLRLETRDHTPAFAKWEAGEISLDEIADTAGANRLQRAVGRGGEPDATWLPARRGWSWLIVSDGIYKSVRMDELARLLDASSAAGAVEAIRRKVEERGPEDNYTAVFIRALDDKGLFAAHANPPVFSDPNRTMEYPSGIQAPPPARSGLAMLATVLSLLALAAAGYALWTVWSARENTVSRTEVDRLRSEMDSLRVQMPVAGSPFGPTSGAVNTDTASLPGTLP